MSTKSTVLIYRLVCPCRTVRIRQGNTETNKYCTEDLFVLKMITSILAFVQRGISTTMLYTLSKPSTRSGMSCNGEIALPSAVAVNFEKSENMRIRLCATRK